MRERRHSTLARGHAIIAAGAGTGISAKFIEKAVARAHVGTTVGGRIGVKSAVVSWAHTLKTTQDIIHAASQVRKDLFFLAHGGPINTPEDAARVIAGTSAVGFVGASSLERMGIEESLANLTRKFTAVKLPPSRFSFPAGPSASSAPPASPSTIPPPLPRSSPRCAAISGPPSPSSNSMSKSTTPPSPAPAPGPCSPAWPPGQDQ